jgi:flavin-dependent dehydrogenase
VVTGQGDGRMHEAIVVGSGPAGATAAALFAREGASVALLDRVDPREGPPRSVWAGSGVAKILAAARVAKERVIAGEVKVLRFVSGDLKKQATVQLPPDTAYFLDVRNLRSALVEEARASGATLLFGHRVTELRADEHCICARTDKDREAVGKLVFLAFGWESGNELVPPAVRLTGRPAHRFHLEVPGGLPDASRLAEDEMHVALGVGAKGLAYWWRRGNTFVLDVVNPADAEETRGALIALVRTLVGEGEADGSLLEAARSASPTVSPAGKALEADSLVIKRGLIVGEAGGFVRAASYEAVYPSMWSAQLAAEVGRKALQSEQPQDVLNRFENRWRTTIAAHLQPLETDMRFLQPLVFSNESIAMKTALTLLGGRRN